MASCPSYHSPGFSAGSEVLIKNQNTNAEAMSMVWMATWVYVPQTQALPTSPHRSRDRVRADP